MSMQKWMLWSQVAAPVYDGSLPVQLCDPITVQPVDHGISLQTMTWSHFQSQISILPSPSSKEVAVGQPLCSSFLEAQFTKFKAISWALMADGSTSISSELLSAAVADNMCEVMQMKSWKRATHIQYPVLMCCSKSPQIRAHTLVKTNFNW